MLTNINITAVYHFINAMALTGIVALSLFIAMRILATAPAIPMEVPRAEAAHVVMQKSYSGLIAWVNAHEIKITDNFGVSRAISITKDTQILMHGYPVGAATYENLRVLDHVRITSIDDGNDEHAQTIVVQ